MIYDHQLRCRALWVYGPEVSKGIRLVLGDEDDNRSIRRVSPDAHGSERGRVSDAFFGAASEDGEISKRFKEKGLDIQRMVRIYAVFGRIDEDDGGDPTTRARWTVSAIGCPGISTT